MYKPPVRPESSTHKHPLPTQGCKIFLCLTYNLALPLRLLGLNLLMERLSGVKPANSPSVILSTDGKTDKDFACPRKSIIIECVKYLAVRAFFAGKGPVKSGSLGVYHLAENL